MFSFLAPKPSEPLALGATRIEDPTLRDSLERVVTTGSATSRKSTFTSKVKSRKIGPRSADYVSSARREYLSDIYELHAFGALSSFANFAGYSDTEDEHMLPKVKKTIQK